MSGIDMGLFQRIVEQNYNIAQQNAASVAKTAQANIMGAQTNRMVAPSEIESNLAGASNNRAQARKTNVFTDPLSDSARQQIGVDQGLTPSVTTYTEPVPLGFTTPAGEEPKKRSNELLDSLLSPLGDFSMGTTRKPLTLAKGIAKVPGKGSGKVDKVPAKLAPGEAVLNKAAAEKMGRGLIAALNKQGARKMGMV